MVRKAQVKYSPWLHWNTTYKDGWEDNNVSIWLFENRKFSNPLFDIPRDTQAIRFVLSDTSDKDSYKIVKSNYDVLEVETSNGKTYKYRHAISSNLVQFTNIFPLELGSYLSLEYM